MNKVLNINLGGFPFTIDEDAYEKLDNYLKTIHRHFKDFEGCEEITSDIEGRLAELFQEAKGSRKIVALKDVQHAIKIMGTPKDFGAEQAAEDTATKKKKTPYKTGKKLYLDPDNEAIGGVCSGISAFIGIENPLWVRVAFVVGAISSGGLVVLGYFLLWAILPTAKTASDRLAMKGETINVSNIGKVIEEQFKDISSKMSDISDDLSAKKKPTPQRRIRKIKLDQPLRRGFLW